MNKICDQEKVRKWTCFDQNVFARFVWWEDRTWTCFNQNVLLVLYGREGTWKLKELQVIKNLKEKELENKERRTWEWEERTKAYLYKFVTHYKIVFFHYNELRDTK